VKSLVFCPVCGFGVFIENGAINRAKAKDATLYCGRVCAGVGRRKELLAEPVKRTLKADYDRQYREVNRERLRAEKAAYFQRTYDPVKAAVERRKIMPRHVEYCRQPEYVAWKRGYDRTYRAKKDFGPFWEAALLVEDIGKEVLARSSRYQINIDKGSYNKSQFRRRDYERLISG